MSVADEDLIRSTFTMAAWIAPAVMHKLIPRGGSRPMTRNGLNWSQQQNLNKAPRRWLRLRWSQSTQLLVAGIYFLLAWRLLVVPWHPALADPSYGRLELVGSVFFWACRNIWYLLLLVAGSVTAALGLLGLLWHTTHAAISSAVSTLRDNH